MPQIYRAPFAIDRAGDRGKGTKRKIRGRPNIDERDAGMGKVVRTWDPPQPPLLLPLLEASCLVGSPKRC